MHASNILYEPERERERERERETQGRHKVCMHILVICLLNIMSTCEVMMDDRKDMEILIINGSIG